MRMLDISEVADLTGLTPRALRFYEARGLVRAVRSSSGRRHYGPDQLERLHAVTTLKRAGFRLAAISALLEGRPIPMDRLISTQLETVRNRLAELTAAERLLRAALDRLAEGERLDVDTLCALIRKGDSPMGDENWKAVTDAYLSPEARSDFARAAGSLPADFDQQAYAARWSELAARIAAALPLDPASERAKAFLGEWKALLAPFLAVATPAMKEGVGKLYERMDEWKGQQTPPFPSEVWAFIKAAGEAHKDA